MAICDFQDRRYANEMNERLEADPDSDQMRKILSHSACQSEDCSSDRQQQTTGCPQSHPANGVSTCAMVKASCLSETAVRTKMYQKKLRELLLAQACSDQHLVIRSGHWITHHLPPEDLHV